MPETPDAGLPSPVVTLTLSRAVTNGDVDVRVSVAELVPESVELLVDGAPAAMLPQPSYELRWSTHELDEGQHVITARASLGDHVYVSAANALRVDRTAPQLVTQIPRPRDQDVSVHAPIQAIFSEAVDPTTVTTESVRLLVNQADVTTEVRLSADGTTVTLVPAGQLPVDSDVSVTIAPSVTDVAGNALDATSLDWQWAIPRHLFYGGAISAGSIEASNVSAFSFVLDREGRPVVAFVDSDYSFRHGVYVMRWTGGAWEQLGGVLGTSLAESVINACSLQISSEGEITVAWSVESVDGVPGVHVHRWSGSGWAPIGTPITPFYAAAKFTSFKLAMDPLGEPWLVIHEFAAGVTSAIRTWRWDGERWVMADNNLLFNSSRNLSSLIFVMSSTGRFVLAWALQNGGDGAVELGARRWAGTYWVESEAASILSVSAVPIAATVDTEDRLVLARPSHDIVAGAGYRPAVSRSNPRGGWQFLGPFIEGMYPGETNATVEVLDFDPAGQLVALLSEPEVAGGPVNHYVRRWDETSWEPMGPPLLPRAGATPVGPAQFFMTGPEQWVLARIEESEGTPGQRHLHVYRPNN
ncbi:Ig-like domain-containing protein [Myxococcus sp. AM001]|nr:Ig-like domain-containing protein [Myxococcus sp. AM001]